MESTTCPKCGSGQIIRNVRVVDTAANSSKDLSVEVYEKPDAVLFKGSVSVPLSARICGACGYTEMYVSDPAQLLAAASKAPDRYGV